MFGRSNDAHLFSEHEQCTVVPVRNVPIDNDHPNGLAWDRPCRCPWWQSVKHEVIVGAWPDGSAKTETHIVAGCGKTLFTWLLSSAINHSAAALNETCQTRKIVEEDPLKKIAHMVLSAPVRLPVHELDQPSEFKALT